MWLPRPSRLDFQLAYLVMLTRYGLKPLSRWEGRLSLEARDKIRSGGLALETVERRARIGRKVTETVFARSPRRTSLYHKRFNGTRLTHKADVVRLEGWFFGYPSCCVEAFIRSPYAENGLARNDQELLFHWACRECKVTPGLLREYSRIHRECAKLFGDRVETAHRPTLGIIRKAAIAAASVALMAGTTGVASSAIPDDPHWLPVADDQDNDYLSVAEEIVRGTDWWNQDTDGNMVLDGVQTAHLLRQLIDNPPPRVEVTEHLTFGFENCTICYEVVNMGFVRITHLDRGLSIDLPLICLHYLEHGSLSYDGDIHTGRADLDQLKRILFPCDPMHLIPPMGDDPDEDGLLSEEEPVLDTDPGNPDTDGDSLLDGPQVAEGLLPLIGDLPRQEVADRPYMLEYPMDGVEECTICGITYNMGGVEIVNPLEGLAVMAPYVALHTLAHGGHAYRGTYNEGRLIPTILETVLTGEGTAHWIIVHGDTDGDGLTDEEEPYFGLDSEDPDENGNGTPDGRELAVDLASRVHQLPEGPLEDQTYVIHHYTFGHYNCVTCGEMINMGYLEIVDPIVGLSVNVPYYNLHFMDLGGFSTDRDDLYPRVDPRAIAEVLGIPAAGLEPLDPSPSFAFWNAPNPFRMSRGTEIVLALPVTSAAIEVTVYDNSGRMVRELFAGKTDASVTRYLWDGKDGEGNSVCAGIYHCKAKIQRITITRKLTLVP